MATKKTAATVKKVATKKTAATVKKIAAKKNAAVVENLKNEFGNGNANSNDNSNDNSNTKQNHEDKRERPSNENRIKEAFPNENGVNKTKISSTRVSFFNMLTVADVNAITEVLKTFIPDLKKLTITDATAGAGSTVISLAKHFKEVKAVVGDEDTYKALEENLKLYKVGNVKAEHGSYEHKVREFKQDIVLLHPMFKRGKGRQISLFVGDKPITEVVNEAVQVSKLVAVKVPYSFNFNGFLRYLEPNRIVVEKLEGFYLMMINK